MTPENIPSTHNQVMPYLIVRNAAGFSAFLQEVFGGKESHRGMRDTQTIMHAEVTIGNSTIMFADATQQFEERTAGLFIYVPDADASYQKALAAGATTIMEPADQSYGRSCGITDPFGVTWWITS